LLSFKGAKSDSHNLGSDFAGSGAAESDAREPDNHPESDDLSKSLYNAETFPRVVLFLVNENTKIAWVITQDQNGLALMEVTSRLPSFGIADVECEYVLVYDSTEVRLNDRSIIIYAEKITFAATRGTSTSPACLKSFCKCLISFFDAKFLRSVIATTHFYFFDLKCQHVNLDDFSCFILIFTMRWNFRKDKIKRLMKHVGSSSCARSKNGSLNASTVALNVASQFINNRIVVGSNWSGF